MRIRKLSFFEWMFPLMVLAFLAQGTQFMAVSHVSDLRFLFLGLLFLFFFLNRSMLGSIENGWWLLLLLIYLMWCMSTTLWSEVFSLSLGKSVVFAVTVVTLISAGTAWILTIGFTRGFSWLFPVLIMVLISGLLGGSANDKIGIVDLYSGLSGNANNFGFLTAIVSSLLLWKCFQSREKKGMFFVWFILFLIDTHFLFSSYSRSAIVVFLCILLLFILNFQFSKKIVIGLAGIFSIVIVLLVLPTSYVEAKISPYILKGTSMDTQNTFLKAVLHSRAGVWKISYEQALKGGVVGGGFGATIGQKNININSMLHQSTMGYGREKSNSELSIMEETGIIGLVLFVLIIVFFFFYVMPYYFYLKGDEKVAMGLTLGVLLGLLLETLVEAWWDSLGPEVICFWTCIGMIFGMIKLIKEKMYLDELKNRSAM
ncbi:MAG: O-antigen ligase family protein [Coxiellaceae bacterium]|nr:O-antigen ligase family protein [Coxiellaceae bacterium]